MPAPCAGEVHRKTVPLGKQFCPEQIRTGPPGVEQIRFFGGVAVRVLGVKEATENQFLILRRDSHSEIMEIQLR